MQGVKMYKIVAAVGGLLSIPTKFQNGPGKNEFLPMPILHF